MNESQYLDIISHLLDRLDQKVDREMFSIQYKDFLQKLENEKKIFFLSARIY